MKYRIQNSDFGECSDYEPRFASYSVEGIGETVKDFIESVTVEIIDQDGGTLKCHGFNEASPYLQEKILASVGLTWGDYETAMNDVTGMEPFR